MKIVYCGYDFFHGCLRELIRQQHEIVQVFSFSSSADIDSHAYVKEICQSSKIPFSLQPINENDLQVLSRKQCDVLITAGYPYKIPDLQVYGMRGVNIHPTLLPEGRGVWPLPWLILKEFTRSGVTIHRLTPKWDSGEILLQGEFSLNQRDNLESLSAKVQILANQLINTCFTDFDNYWNNAKAQSTVLEYWPYPPAQLRYINWRHSVHDIDKTCRAYGKAGAVANFDDKTWLIYDLVAWQSPHRHECGTVVHKTNTEMIIAASDGYCSLRYFSPAPANISGKGN